MNITIIIPCYNSEGSISQCINSVIGQNYTDWELILVNDGSTDNTGVICENFAKLDNRIKVIHQNNKGVSSARNTGIKAASGNYISFIDSDDTIDSSYLYELSKGQEADLIVCGFHNDSGINFIPENNYLDKDAIQYHIKDVIENDYLLYTPWCKLFRKEIIVENGLTFDVKLRLGEDTIFCYNFLLLCSSLKTVASNAYYYRGEWGGITKYKLSYEEVYYLDNSEITILKQINQKYCCNIDIKRRGFHIQLLDKLYEDYTDITTWELYCSTHGYIDKNVFFNDNSVSTIFWSIVDLENIYHHHEINEGIIRMSHLNKFYTIPTYQLKSLSIRMKILHWNIRHNLLWINDKLLNLLCK